MEFNVIFVCKSFVNFLTFLVSTKRKCHICDVIIVLHKSTLTQSKALVAYEDAANYHELQGSCYQEQNNHKSCGFVNNQEELEWNWRY